MKKILFAFLIMIVITAFGSSGTISTPDKNNIVFRTVAPVSQNLPAVPLAGGTMTGPLVLSGAPTMSLQAANKGYVDSLAGGLIPVGGVAAGSTANLNATYVNGAAGVGATLTNAGTLAVFTIDGVTPAITSRILVKDQTLPAQNGVYTLTTVGSGAAAWVLTRATDYDSASEIKPGTLVSISSGTLNTGASYYETATVVTVGTDPINFSVFFSPAGYLQVANNLNDVASPSTARTNLGLAIGTNVEAWGAPLDQITAGTWAGASSITALGTIATGIWHGSVIPSLYGGSGVASPTAHSVLIGEGASPFSNVTLANNQFLWGATGADPVAATFSGAGGVTITPLSSSVIIGLSAVPNSSLANSSVTLTSGTNISITGSPLSLGGTATVNVAAPFAATTLTSNGLLQGNGASNISAITPVNNAVVVTNSSGIPSESTTLPAGLTIPGHTTTGDITVNGVSPIGLNFIGSTGNNQITIPVNATDGLHITDGVSLYSTFSSANQSPRITNSARLNQNAPLNNAYFMYTPGGVYNNNGVLQASESGTTVTGVGTNFPAGCADGYIYWPATGDVAHIASRDSATQLTVDQSQTVASSKFEVWNSGLGVGFAGMSNVQGLPINLGNIDTPPASTGASTTVEIGATNATGAHIHVPFTAALNMGSNLISNVTDPVSAQDASTKNYTDLHLANYLPLAGGALTGGVTSTNNYSFVPTAVVTTMSQSGILATITGGNSNYAGAYVVPATGSAFTNLNYQGTTTFPTNVSQTIAGGTACTVYYYPNGNPLDAPTNAVGQVGLFSNIQYLALAPPLSYRSFYNASSATFSISGGLPTSPNNAGNQTASQSGTTVTGVGTNWNSTYKWHMIRFATGQVGWITAVGSTTSMTVAQSQTVASTDFDIPGKISAVEATSADAQGNFGTNNAYINSNLFLPSGYTLTTNISGNAATVTTNANLTGDVTSSGNATTYNNAVPLSKSLNANLTASNGGIFYSTASAGAVLAGTATAGKVLQSGATAAPTWSTPTYPSASGSAGTIIRSDGTNNIYSTSTFADTYPASNLLYSNGANTVTGLATANNGTLVTNGSGVPSISSTLPSAVQNLITAVNSAANTLGIGGSTKTFVAGAVNIPSVSGVTSFTPGVAFGGGTTGVTYSGQTGFYTTTTYPNGTIEVHVWGSFNLTNKGSSTGNATLTGLPISTGANGTLNLPSFVPAGITVASGALPLLQLQNNGTSANIDSTSYNGAGFAQVNNTQFSNSSSVAFNFSYWNN